MNRENKEAPKKSLFGEDFEKFIGVGVLILVMLAGALAMSPSVADPDLWGHVQFGKDAIENGSVAETTSYSFTAQGFRWINHENLSEITMAFVVNNFGPIGLLWGKFILSLLVIGSIVWFNFKQGVSLIPTVILALLVASNLGYHWSFRPQLSSFVLFTAVILLLQYCFTGWRDQWHLRIKTIRLFEPDHSSAIQQSWLQGRLLWLAVPLILIWTNSHGGFVAGVCIVIAYLMLRAFEAYQVKREKSWGLIRRMVLISAAVALATMVNPYSYRLPMWLLESLRNPRPEIVDWSNGQLWTLVGLKFWVLIAFAFFAIIYSSKKKDFVHLVVLAITLWQALSHFRHVPFFTILCGFWLGPHLQSAIQSLKKASDDRVAKLQPLQQYASYAMLLVLIVGVSLGVSNRLSHIQVDRSVYPVDAFSYMKQNEINGRIVVTYNWAQYTIAALCTEDDDSQAVSRVAFDGRFRTCYPQQVVDMHFDFLYGKQEVLPRHRSPDSPPVDPGRVLEYREPELVINKRFDEATSKHMNDHKDQWCLLYQDGLAQVWGSRKKYDDPNSRNYLSPELRVISDQLPTGIVAWPALPISRNGASRRLVEQKLDSPNYGPKS